MYKLTQREKRLLLISGVFLGALILLFLIIMPIINFLNKSEEEYKNNLSNLNKLEQIYKDYKEIEQNMKQVESKIKNTKGVASLIEKNAEDTKILQNKVYIRDRPSRVQGKYKTISTDVKFEGVNMEYLLNFIYNMEVSNKLLKISYLRINRTLKGKSTYDAQIKFDSFTEE